MPFTCYAVYMDCMHVDSLVAAMVLKLLNKLELSCDTNYIVKKVNQSNLYMWIKAIEMISNNKSSVFIMIV